MSRIIALLLVAACSTGAQVAPTPAASSLAPAVTAAEVELGLDLRALPVGASPRAVDAYVLGQGDALRARSPRALPVELRYVPGWGVLYARFESTDPATARALCARVIASYLTRAPRLPVTGEPAVRVTTPCHAVETTR